jgi:hypothetical protein
MLGLGASVVAACVLALPASAQAVTTVDEAQAAGVYQQDQSFNTLVFDYNQDGYSDFLYTPQNDKPGHQLWRNNQDGTFTLVTHLQSSYSTDMHGCVSADFDRNGLPDVYCALGAIHGTRTKANPLWLQQPDGTWQLNEASGAQDPAGRGYSASVLDANGDGWPDLFVDNYHPRKDGLPTPDRLFLNRGDDPVTGQWLGFVDAGAASGVEQEEGDRGCDFTTDFNGDGYPDIVFCGSARMYFYENDGTGHFTDVSAQLLGGGTLFASDAELVDVNGDGIRDLVFVKSRQWGIRLGQANGTFARATTHPETAGRMIAVADANGDGLPDVYVLQGNGTPGCTGCTTNYPDQLWINTGFGQFTQSPIPNVTSGSGDTVNAIDINNDGRFEFLVANGANLTNGPLELLATTP